MVIQMMLRAACVLAAISYAGPSGAEMPVAGTAGQAAPAAGGAVDWQAAPVRLLMVEREGCIYCAAWNREIGPGYAKSSEGRSAPLLRLDIGGAWPDGLVLDRRPVITPTFILIERGRELARLEGYPGEDFFYPLIDGMLTDAGLAP